MGAPVFDRLEADLAKAMMSLPRLKDSKSAVDSMELTSKAPNTTTYLKKGKESKDPVKPIGWRTGWNQ